MNLANTLLNLGRGIAHPFAEMGTALAYTPKAIYREVQGKPIDDIQQRVFGTNDQGQIAKRIIGDTAQLGLTAVAPGASKATFAMPTLAGQVGMGTLSGGLLGGAMNMAGKMGYGNTPTIQDFGQGAAFGALLGGVTPLARASYIAARQVPLNEGGYINLPGGRREVVTGAPGDFTDLRDLVTRGQIQNNTETLPIKSLKLGSDTMTGMKPDQLTIQRYMKLIQNDQPLQPLIIDSKGYVQDGAHRLMAMKRLGITDAPVVRQSPNLSGAALQSALSNDATMSMWQNYFQNNPAVKGSALSGEGAMAPRSLSAADKAKLMKSMRK